MPKTTAEHNSLDDTSPCLHKYFIKTIRQTWTYITAVVIFNNMLGDYLKQTQNFDVLYNAQVYTLKYCTLQYELNIKLFRYGHM